MFLLPMKRLWRSVNWFKIVKGLHTDRRYEATFFPLERKAVEKEVAVGGDIGASLPLVTI
jgi:hypothetical protein